MRCASPPASVAADADEAEVVEADVEQEPHAGVDLLDHPLGDDAVALGELEAFEGLGGLADRQCRRSRRCCGRRRDRQSDAGLRRAPPHTGHGHLPHVALDLLPLAVALGLAVAALEVRDRRPRSWRCTSGRGRSGSCSGPAPCRRRCRSRNACCCFFVSFDHGASASTPSSSATASTRRLKYWLRPLAHGAMAPSASDRSRLGTTSSGSTSKRVPRPSQVSHAPYGELNEKLRGASSSNDHAAVRAGEVLARRSACRRPRRRRPARLPSRHELRPRRRRRRGAARSRASR